MPKKRFVHTLAWRKQKRESTRQWRKLHPHKARRIVKRSREKHWDTYLAAMRRWRRKNTKKVNAYQRAWNRAHPKYHRRYKPRWQVRSAIKRAKAQGAPGVYTVAQWLHLLERQHWRCLYCRKRLTLQSVATDHKTPLSRGGSNRIGNLAGCCRRCSDKKASRTLQEFVLLTGKQPLHIHPQHS